MIKTIIFLNILLIISIFFRYKPEVSKEAKLTKIKENNKMQIIRPINLSEYNMVKFIAYDNADFNTMWIYDIFKNKYFNISYLNYAYSEEYKKVKFEFLFGIYNQNKTLIEPSDFSLYTGFTVLCLIKVNKTIIYSLPQIKDNKFYGCIEFFKLNENPQFGIHIFRQKKIYYLTLTFNFTKYLNFNDNEHEDDAIFDNDTITKKYEEKHLKSFKNIKKNMLWRNYMQSPICDLKRNVVGDKNGWVFKNIYNNYFCYCIGKACTKKGVNQLCKLNFYKNVIDINRNLYPKTEYIFVDFIFKNLSSDDTFPVFEEMMNQNLSAHYITEREDLYDKYCRNKSNCQTIIPINRYTYFRFGDFKIKSSNIM
jgi:hypothetical protein